MPRSKLQARGPKAGGLSVSAGPTNPHDHDHDKHTDTRFVLKHVLLFGNPWAQGRHKAYLMSSCTVHEAFLLVVLIDSIQVHECNMDIVVDVVGEAGP